MNDNRKKPISANISFLTMGILIVMGTISCGKGENAEILSGPAISSLTQPIRFGGVPDLAQIKKSGTGSHSTEVHIYSGASRFATSLLHTGTVLTETDDTFTFTMVDWDRDGILDLVAIEKSGTGTHSTEVHIYSGATNYSTALLHTGTAEHETGITHDFAMTDWDRDGVPDLVVIDKSGTGTHSTEVHIYSGATKFSTALLHTGTALHETGATHDFAIADWDLDGIPDLVAFDKSGTGTHSTEVHIYSGATKFSTALLHTGTALAETDETSFLTLPAPLQENVSTIMSEDYEHYMPSPFPIGERGDDVFELDLPPGAKYVDYRLEVTYTTLAGKPTSDAQMVVEPTVGQRGGTLRFVVHWWYNGWAQVSYHLVVHAKSYNSLPLQLRPQRVVGAPPPPPPLPAGGVHVVDIRNTSADTQSIWDYSSSGTYTWLGDMAPGANNSVTLSSGQTVQLYVISHRWVDDWNRSWGTSYDPHTQDSVEAGRFTSAFQDWLVGSTTGGTIPFEVSQPAF